MCACVCVCASSLVCVSGSSRIPQVIRQCACGPTDVCVYVCVYDSGCLRLGVRGLILSSHIAPKGLQRFKSTAASAPFDPKRVFSDRSFLLIITGRHLCSPTSGCCCWYVLKCVRVSLYLCSNQSGTGGAHLFKQSARFEDERHSLGRRTRSAGRVRYF